MKTIRKNVFETNSSSVHSITFSTAGSGVLPPKSFILNIEGGDYGWEQATYLFTDNQDKFSYWLSAFIYCAFLLYEKKEEEYKKHGMPQSVINEKSFQEIYDNYANVLLYLRDKGVNMSISYDGYQHDLETYLRDFYVNNTSRDISYSNFDFLIDTHYGIDHQSAPRESTDCRRLGESSPEEVFDWVFGDGEFRTNNDNH
jgi:hypothetical protein